MASATSTYLSKGAAGLFALLVVTILFSCEGPGYSPFSTDVPEEMSHLNEKNLQKIASRITPGDSFKIALISDPQRDPGALAQVVQLINQRSDLHEIAFAIILGDITDYGLMFEYEDAFAALEPLQIPFLGVIGNHDSISNGKAIYREMFGAYDYAFDYKGSRLIVYNNNSYEFEGVPNQSWIAAQATGFETRNHTIGVAHIANLNEGSAESTTAFRDFLVSNGIRHAVYGHFHRFDYLIYPNGLEIFIVDKVAVGKLHYGMMTVTPTQVVFEQCTKTGCIPALESK